jgi:predicted RNase H-like HicB family nuclease
MATAEIPFPLPFPSRCGGTPCASHANLPPVSVEKTLEKLLRSESDANIRFDELCRLLEARGFRLRISGSHHIFVRHGVVERINIQRDGSRAKPYQVRNSPHPRRKQTAMTNNRYEMIVWWSREGAAFVVDVPELPGCLAHGERRLEAIKNAEDAIAFWIETARQDGLAIPEPKGRLLVA